MLSVAWSEPTTRSVGSQSDEVPDISCVKSTANWKEWYGVRWERVDGLSKIHIVPLCETINANYYTVPTETCTNSTETQW